ncbi:MAG TPA: glycosyltransferase family A protein [Symbiobacteriaceae bacterium]
MRAAVESVLAQDYPDFEVVLIDDRSTDDTGAIVDDLAAEYPTRVRATHITTLPPGWLGKNHALYQGVRQSTGEWLLFTDADVHFHPGALRAALAYVTRGAPHGLRAGGNPPRDQSAPR